MPLNDPNFVKPLPSEFPKMVFKPEPSETAGYISKVVNSQAEQDALSKKWLVTKEAIHDFLDAKAKAQYVDKDDDDDEVETKSDPVVDISKMNKDELVAHAAEVHSLELDPAQKKADLVKAIEEAQSKA